MDKIEIRPESILLKGITTKKGYCDTIYIVFKMDDKIFITGNQHKWVIKENNIYVYPTYIRLLANSIEEFLNLSISRIESQAYGAWMDGAK